MPLKINTLLFDLDGTLIDTETLATETTRACFLNWNIHIENKDLDYLVGKTWDNTFTTLFHKYPPPIPLNSAKKEILSQYRDALKSDMRPIAGSVEAVQSLSQHFHLGLVSSSHRKDILWCLRKLKIESHFQVILGVEDITHEKPDPESYLKALATLNASAKQCLAFEDSLVGMTAARKAGLWVVGITHSSSPKQDFTLAHLKIPDFTQVSLSWIKNLSFAG